MVQGSIPAHDTFYLTTTGSKEISRVATGDLIRQHKNKNLRNEPADKGITQKKQIMRKTWSRKAAYNKQSEQRKAGPV